MTTKRFEDYLLAPGEEERERQRRAREIIDSPEFREESRIFKEKIRAELKAALEEWVSRQWFFLRPWLRRRIRHEYSHLYESS